MRRLLLALALAGGLAVAPATSGRAIADPFAGCQPPGASVVVGTVSCMREPAADLGGTTAFSYFVPRGCAERSCPTLYLLHGFGGDLRSMLGTARDPSAWVAALDSKPAVSPYRTSTPWKYADQRDWKPAAPIEMVLVAPDGRTVAGGYGPGPLLDGFWADWNPRYAKGGAAQRYATPAPRFASYVVDDLVPFVERNLPVARGRVSRVLDGESLGGYGSYAIGLTHPDAWASIGADSGIMNILLAPGLGGVGPPPVRTPGVLGGTVPLSALPGPARDFDVVLYAFGDPVADEAYYLARQPVDLAMNAAAFAHRRQSLMIRGFSNDTVPRVASDFSLPGYLSSQAFEDLVLPTNVEMNQAFSSAGVREHYELHPGIHEDIYWNPWLRAQVVAQYAVVRHADGTGNPPPAATRFSYTSGARAFGIWGWRFAVRRAAEQMLQLTDVTCHGLTLRGSGVVVVTPPARCGAHDVRVDLGRSVRQLHVPLED